MSKSKVQRSIVIYAGIPIGILALTPFLAVGTLIAGTAFVAYNLYVMNKDRCSWSAAIQQGSIYRFLKTPFFKLLFTPVLMLTLAPFLMMAGVIVLSVVLGLMAFKGASWKQATRGLRQTILQAALPLMRQSARTARFVMEGFGLKLQALTTEQFPQDHEPHEHPISVNEYDGHVTLDGYTQRLADWKVPNGVDIYGTPVNIALTHLYTHDREPEHVVINFGGNCAIQSLEMLRATDLNSIASVSPDTCESYVFDRRDTGHSSGLLVNPNELIDDAEAVYNFVRRAHPDKSIILAGHSMGAYEAVKLAARIHKKADENSGPLPRVISMYAFSKLSRVVTSMATRQLGSLGTAIGYVASGIMKVIGADMDVEPAWNSIPDEYKDYLVIQGSKFDPLPLSGTRHDEVIGESAALHNAKSVKGARKRMKRSLKKQIAEIQLAAANVEGSPEALQSDFSSSEVVASFIQAHRASLNRIKSHKVSSEQGHNGLMEGTCRGTGVTEKQYVRDFMERIPEAPNLPM